MTWYLLYLFVCGQLAGVLCADQMEVCPQLGCDFANKFSLMQFNLPRQLTGAIWQTTKRPPLPIEQESAGCVGNTDILICSAFSSPRDDYSSAEFLQTWTGDVISYDNVEFINKTVGANLRNDSRVFMANGAQAQLVDTKTRTAQVMSHPKTLVNGTMSPVLLEDLSYHVVVGNASSDIFLYSVDSGDGAMRLLAHFNVTSPKASCAWSFMTQPAVLGTRMYMYSYIPSKGAYFDSDEAMIAIDFMDKAPYYKVAWILDMNPDAPKSNQSCDGGISLPIGPPIDIQCQLMVTEDRHIIFTDNGGLFIAYDNGTSGSSVTASPWGGHFMSKMPGSDYVWMNGFLESKGFRKAIVGMDTTNLTSGNSYKLIELVSVLSVDDVNVTSRLLSLVTSHSTFMSEALVFGVRVYASDSKSRFFTDICPSCLHPKSADDSYGMLVAMKPRESKVIWTYRLPDNYVIKGQIIALNDKFVLSLKNTMDGGMIVMAVH